MVKRKTNIKDICNYYKQETHWAKEYKKENKTCERKKNKGTMVFQKTIHVNVLVGFF
jgi:hypothetical protein